MNWDEVVSSDLTIVIRPTGMITVEAKAHMVGSIKRPQQNMKTPRKMAGIAVWTSLLLLCTGRRTTIADFFIIYFILFMINVSVLINISNKYIIVMPYCTT